MTGVSKMVKQGMGTEQSKGQSAFPNDRNNIRMINNFNSGHVFFMCS